jgi:hypothetical protein
MSGQYCQSQNGRYNGLTYSFLEVGIASQLGILGRVRLSLDGLPFASLAVIESVS